MGDGSQIRTVALICPSCGEKIRAPRGDVLFYCSGCRRASEFSGKSLEDRTLVTLGASPEFGSSAGNDVVRLPLWCFDVHVQFSGDEPRTVSDLEKVARPDHVFVPAFRQKNVALFGDMGMMLTLRPPALEPGDPAWFGGGTLASRQAVRLVEPMILGRADQVHDVTGIEVLVEVVDVRVVTVPARDEGSGIVDLLTGKSWPAAAFWDLDSIRSGYLR